MVNPNKTPLTEPDKALVHLGIAQNWLKNAVKNGNPEFAHAYAAIGWVKAEIELQMAIGEDKRGTQE